MDLAALERHPLFRRAYWLRNLYVLLTIVAEVLVLWLLATIRINSPSEAQEKGIAGFSLLGFVISFEVFSPGTFGRIAIFVAVQMGLSHYQFIRALRRRKHMIQLYPKDQSKGTTFGSLSGAEIVQMVLEQAEKLGVGKIAYIGVARQPDPNAYTARLLGLGNIVVLHRNLLEVLPPEGVRTVIAHEVGHIRRKDSLFYQLLGLPRLFAWVLTALIFLKIAAGLLDSDSFGEALGRTFFLVMALGVLSYLFGWLEKLGNLASQQTELMVDAYGALMGGWENHMNALLRIGERAEALTAFAKALGEVALRIDTDLNEGEMLRMLGRLPPRVLQEGLARDAAVGLFVIDRLQQLRKKLRVPLSDEQIGDLASRAAEAYRMRNVGKDGQVPDPRTEEERQQEAEEKTQLLDWRAFDTNQSGRLDAPEIDALVADLRANPKRMIFRQFLEGDAEWLSHPTTRRRILFLYDVFAGKK